MIKGVGHIGIYVRNLEETLESLSKIVDFSPPMISDPTIRQVRYDPSIPNSQANTSFPVA